VALTIFSKYNKEGSEKGDRGGLEGNMKEGERYAQQADLID